MLVIRLQFLRLYNYFSHKRGGKMKPESGKLTIGRNDSCPGGQSVKFKKCLVAHRELHERSTPAEVGWVCSRWQAAVPPLEERLAAMPSRRTGAMEKLDQVLEEAIKVGRFVFFCPSPTSAGFGAESFVHAGLAFLSVTISGCLPRFDGPHDFVGDLENLIDLALCRIRCGSFSQSQRRSLGGW
jgi:hypothetical protein